MKKNSRTLTKFFLVVLLLCSVYQVVAQAPQKMSYQSVIRNTSNALIASTPIGMRISILQGSSSGPSVYTETQTPTTNVNGLASIEIGTGTVVSGTFSSINWGNGPYFIKSEVDPLGGTTYTIAGTTQLTSVPYALFSATSGSGETPGTAVGDMKYWNGTAWVMIPVGTPGQFLQLNSSSIPSWSGGTYVSLTTDTIPVQTYFNSFVATGGNVTNLGITAGGGSPITGFGMCWSTSPNPTIADSNSLNPANTGLGAFASYIAGLLPNTTYYIRAFAINSAGTAYGNQVTFTTYNPTIPTVTTTVVSGITGGIANSGGNVTNDGGAFVANKGVCWSTSPNPSLANSFVVSGNNLGSYTSIMNGLVPNTTYYMKAYATNVAGTAYGNEVSFTTTSTLSIGSFHQGGLIGYFLQPGDPGYSPTIPHGIIVTQNNVGAGVSWGCQGTLITGANSTTIGGGAQNTVDIIAGCSTLGIAAELCDSLVLNGYSDWFLPSDNEWIALSSGAAISANVINNAQGYWTSNQNNANNANILFNNFPSYTGYIGNIGKNDASSYGGVVRAIRMF